ncbi:MAG: SDR family NAD(P)-dependent oxidoreductase [Fimbriimonadales bacterium]
MQGNVLITGASRGIGRAIAQRLAQDGWRPLIHYKERRSEAELVAVETRGVAAPLGTDLSIPADCQKLWKWAIAEGPVRALVNNAGLYIAQAFDIESDDAFAEAWRASYETNFGSSLRLTRYFLKQARDGDRILNVCSRVGFRGEAGAAHYAASKAALANLTRSLAIELAPKKIGVFGIAPGWVETAMIREGMEARKAEIIAGIPLGRVAAPEDCAAAAAFLMSDDASYLSGQIIDVNGASYFH